MASNTDSQYYPSFFWHHERTKTSTGSKIMLTAIVSLSFIALLVSMLHVYARCVLRRQARRRAAMRQMRIITAAHYQAGEPPSRGLNPAVVASLPKFVYKRSVESEAVSTDQCSVCLSSLDEGEAARKLPNCGHTFHAECIDKWLGSQSTCPVCRAEAEPKPGAVQPEPREGVIGAPVLETGGSSSFRLSSFRKIWDHRSSNRVLHIGSDDERCSSVDLERQ